MKNASCRTHEEFQKALSEMGKGCRLQAKQIKELNREINRLKLELRKKDREITKLRNVITTLKWG